MHKRETHIEYNPDIKRLTQKKRVCAYARVSGDHDDAFHSLSAQISYYQKKIAAHPEWEFVEVFSDRGITGTKENREGFQRMLTACREGKIDIVLAKSITRFARNTLILLSTMRELKSLGVDIQFEEEHINTLSEKGELMISILAARAQEESRQASENKKWQYQKAFQKGIPFNSDCLGYRIIDHRIWMEEDEAPIVKRIFEMYLSGMGTVGIAKTLMKEGIKNRKGTTFWSDGIIRHMLQNEIYVGDLRLQKTFCVDHISKKNRLNRGERKMYYIKDDHDPIITREMFAQVQEELKRRSANHPTSGKRPSQFSRLIVCENCGNHLCQRTVRPEDDTRWECSRALHYGRAGCELTFSVANQELTQATCIALKLDSLDGVNLRERLSKIIHTKNDELIYVFNDGTKTVVKLKPHRCCPSKKKPNKKRKEKNHGSKTTK